MAARNFQRSAQINLPRNGTLFNQILQWTVFAYQAIAVIIFLVGMYLSVRWFQQPFLGALYEHTMVFNGTGPSEAMPEWALFKQVVVGDQMVAIDGTPVRNTREVRSILQGHVPGENVTVTVKSESGQSRDVSVTLHNFPASSRTTYFIVPSILGLVFIIASWWIFGLRRNEPAGRAFSLFTSSLAIVTGAYFNLVTTHEFTVFWTFALAIMGGALFDLGLSFPLEPRVVINRPYLRWVGLIIGIVLAVFNLTTLFNFERPTAYIPIW